MPIYLLNKTPNYPDYAWLPIFLLLNSGNTQAQTAELIGCSLRKIAYWSLHGEPDNLESFKDNKLFDI